MENNFRKKFNITISRIKINCIINILNINLKIIKNKTTITIFRLEGYLK